jgi:hypothetical protein
MLSTPFLWVSEVCFRIIVWEGEEKGMSETVVLETRSGFIGVPYASLSTFG